jgi:hypothetical protein
MAGFLLIIRTGTHCHCPQPGRVAPDSRTFQHIANYTYSIAAAGGNDVTLGPFLMLLLGNIYILERAGHFCRPLMVAHESGLSHPTTALGRWAWRIVSEDSIHPVAPLSTAVHPFPESQNLVVVIVA